MQIIMQVIGESDKHTEFNAGSWDELLKTFIPTLRRTEKSTYICMTDETFRMDRFIGLEYPKDGVAVAIYSQEGDYYTTHKDWGATVDWITGILTGDTVINALEITSAPAGTPPPESETELPLDVKPAAAKKTRKKP